MLKKRRIFEMLTSVLRKYIFWLHAANINFGHNSISKEYVDCLRFFKVRVINTYDESYWYWYSHRYFILTEAVYILLSEMKGENVNIDVNGEGNSYYAKHYLQRNWILKFI